MRFDEVELQAEPAGVALPLSVPEVSSRASAAAPRFKRLLALLTDLSLFAALTLALTPLLPSTKDPYALLGLTGFVVLVSYYYFSGAWLLWGKSVGGAIFDVR